MDTVTKALEAVYATYEATPTGPEKQGAFIDRLMAEELWRVARLTPNEDAQAAIAWVLNLTAQGRLSEMMNATV